MKTITPDLILTAAKAAHEVNRAYCIGLGDQSQTPWIDAQQWQRDSAIDGAQAIADDPNLPHESSHVGWMKQKLDDGWEYGPVKDPDKKEHPCLVPYEDLPSDQQHKDALFGHTVRGVLGL